MTAGSRRVLVVEDLPDVALATMRVLKHLHHEAVLAVDGVSALALAESFRPDVVLLDVGLPDMPGHEVARRLRASELGTTVVIVMLSAWGQPGVQATARAAGADRYLLKPASLADLRAALLLQR